MTNPQLIKQITPELSLEQFNEIPVLCLTHKVGTALIALQGAQLLQWQPAGSLESVLWLSEVESFKLGSAIRGGVPPCFPWFGGAGTPAHGTARIRLWALSEYHISDERVELTFSLFENNIIEASLQMAFSHECQLTFTNYAHADAQLALHSYFNVSQIENATVAGLPTECFSRLSDKIETVPSPRTINEHIDCTYAFNGAVSEIRDSGWGRTIRLTHHNASDLVLWNPWQLATSAMSATGYQTMLCLESARIREPIQPRQSLGVTIAVVND